MAIDFKTFIFKGNLNRLASLLITIGYPYNFNGSEIEITCEYWYFEQLKKNDINLFEKLEIVIVE